MHRDAGDIHNSVVVRLNRWPFKLDSRIIKSGKDRAEEMSNSVEPKRKKEALE